MLKIHENAAAGLEPATSGEIPRKTPYFFHIGWSLPTLRLPVHPRVCAAWIVAVYSPVAAPYYPKTAAGPYGDRYDHYGYLELLTIYACVLVACKAWRG